MIYTAHDIKRIAGEHLCKDFTANPNLTFTNTSYGARGEVVGSLTYSDNENQIETTILYVVKQPHWDSLEATLKRVETVKKYQIIENGVEVRPYSNEETEDVILTVYTLDGGHNGKIYTDDKDMADQASKIRVARWEARYKREDELKKENNKKRILIPNTSLYDSFMKLIEEQDGRAIKYGSPITVRRYIGEQRVYNHDTHQYETHKYACADIHYVYRNKQYVTTKSQSKRIS